MNSCSFLNIGLRLCMAFMALLMTAFSHASEIGVTDKEIIIGQTIALQDGNNSYGVAAAQGAKLYFDMVNAGGGLHGRKIVLRVLDDDNKAANAEANARKLVADGAFILFGSIEGGPSNAIMKVANEFKVPFFGPMAGSPTFRRPYQPFVFPVRAEHRDEFRALMAWGKTTGLDSIGFLYSDTDVGRAHLENVKLLADELGLRIVAPIPFRSDVTDAQLDEIVRVIAAKKPEIFFNHGSSDIYQKLIDKAKAAGLTTSFMGVNSGSTQIVHGLGSLARGMVFTQVVPNPMQGKHAISQEYQDAMRKSGNKSEYSYGGLEGFMTAKALVMALRATGRDPGRSGLIKTLESSRYDLGGVSVRYAPGDHMGSGFVDLSIVSRDGLFVH